MGAMIVMMILTGFAWEQMRSRLSDNETLNANIARMTHIDEILTSSALLATATGDLSYRTRYYETVPTLDRILTESMALFQSDRAEDMLMKTQTANNWLVTAEENALATTRNGPNAAAYASLRSSEYTANKVAYMDGLQATIQSLETLAQSRIARMKQALAGLGVLFVLSGLMLARALWRARLKHQEFERKQEQITAMRGMINTFMDLQNNLLNNMVYFRTKAACNLAFDDDDVRIIDNEIERSKSKLSELVDTGIGTTRDLGGIVVVDNHSSELNKAA